MNPTRQTLSDSCWLEIAPGHYIKKPQTAAQVNAPQVGQVDLPSPVTLPPATLRPSTPSLSLGALSHNGTTGREAASPKRIRQSSKPLLNKLETEWFAVLNAQFPNFPRPRAQAKRYRLGNGIWYKPDFSASSWPGDGPAKETCWEVKGPHAFRGGLENLKVAAGLYPEIRWILVWKEKGRWQQQNVLP